MSESQKTIPEKKERRRCTVCNAYLRSSNKNDQCDSHSWPKGKRGASEMGYLGLITSSPGDI